MKITFKEVKEREPLTIGYGFLTKTAPYEFIRYFWIWFFANIGFTANQVTLLWGFLGVAGIIFLGIGNYYLMILGAFLMAFAVFLDDVDGAIARLRNERSKTGIYLDTANHIVHFPLFFLALGIGLFRMNNEIFLLYLGLFVSYLYVLNSSLKDNLYKTFFNESAKIRKKIQKKKSYSEWQDIVDKREKTFRARFKFGFYNAVKFNSSLVILIFIAILNLTRFYLYFYAIFFSISFLRNIFQIKKILAQI